jgi:hypothetical protein
MITPTQQATITPNVLQTTIASQWGTFGTFTFVTIATANTTSAKPIKTVNTTCSLVSTASRLEKKEDMGQISVYLAELTIQGHIRKVKRIGYNALMIELTEHQRHELQNAEPLVVDPQTRETYVLVRRESYERLKDLLALDEFDPDEGAGYINEVMAEDDANDPLLDSYQDYGKKPRSVATS